MFDIILTAKNNLSELHYVSSLENYFVYEYVDPMDNKTTVKVKEITGYEYEVVISVLDMASVDKNDTHLQTFTSISAKDQPDAISIAFSQLVDILKPEGYDPEKVSNEDLPLLVAEMRWHNKRASSLIRKKLSISDGQLTKVIRSVEYLQSVESLVLSGIESDKKQRQMLKEICWRAKEVARRDRINVKEVFNKTFALRMLINQDDAKPITDKILSQMTPSGRTYISYLN